MGKLKITVEDITSEEQLKIVEVIGLEAYLKLVTEFGGLALYIQKADYLTKKVRDREIKRLFDGGNYRKLALKFNLSEAMVRTIVSGENKLEGQMTFEE